MATVGTSLDAIRGELSHTKLSASTLNLVVWIDDPNRRDWILERAGLVAQKHPSFTLILDHTGVRAGGATVSATEPDERQTAQGERVDIDVADADPATIDGYMSGLCAGGVPTVLWWSGTNAVSRPIFDALITHADMLLVDSSGSAQDESGIRRVAAFHAEHGEIVLRDLAWLRLRLWQEMIAAFFDDPQLLDELFAIRSLRITSGSDAEALYLGGWLASRLGWTASGPKQFTDRNGATVSFSHAREGNIRRVVSVCLDSGSSTYHGKLTEDPNVVSVWVEGEHAREPRLFPLRALDNASLLERAILEPGRDEVFEVALETVNGLLN